MKRASRYPWLETGACLLALLLPLAFNPFATQPFEMFKVRLVWAVVAGMLFGAVISGIRNRDQFAKGILLKRLSGYNLAKLREDNPLLFPALAYGGVYVLATLNSIDPRLSLIGTGTRLGTITVLSLVLFFILVAAALRSRTQVERVVTALLVGSVPVAIYGWVQRLGLDPLEWATISHSPVHSTVGYSLYLGAYLAMVIPFTLSRILASQGGLRKRPVPYLLVLVLQVSCLFLTLSRGAWLGFVAGGLLFLWLLAYRWGKKSLIILSMVFLLIAGFLYIAMSSGWMGLLPAEQAGLAENPVIRTRTESDKERMSLWSHTLAMIPGRSMLGYGPETFYDAFWQHYPSAFNPELVAMQVWDPHNLFLYHLTATGILGLFAFLYLLYRFYRIGFATIQSGQDRRGAITTAAILGSVTAYLVQAQFNPNAILLMTLFWLLLALGVSVQRQGAVNIA